MERRSVRAVLCLVVVDVVSIAGGPQHPAQVDDHLRVDVLVLGLLQGLSLAPEGHEVLAVVAFLDGANRQQQGEDVAPLNVVPRRMPQDLLQRVAVMAAHRNGIGLRGVFGHGHRLGLMVHLEIINANNDGSTLRPERAVRS